MKGKCLSMLICMLFISSAFSIAINGRDYGKENTGENVIATITYKSNECSIATLQPIVVITQPADGAVVTDPHLTVLGYATDEIGMNYWEWEWHWKGGSYSNSSYFETAEYVEFKIDIYGLHPGWNLIIVRFKNIYGTIGEDSVNVTYNLPNNPPNKPTKPEGPTSGKVKETLYFNTVTTDPDGDSLEYLIDWGDGTNTGWLGPIVSGYPFESFHAWDEPGTYEVKAKARDISYLEESEWSEPLIVTISSEDTEPPVVIKKYPPDGATFTELNITAWGYVTDNVGVVSFGYTQEWEGGGTGSSWPLEEPTTNYSFEIPLTLHEGWNRIRIEASDAAGNTGYDEETVTYVVEDTIPPTTTLVIGEPKYFREEEETWYVTSETPFTLVAEDNEGGSGVNYTMCRIWYDGNWSDWLKYTESFTLEGEGPHYIEFYSVDKASNIEDVHNNTYIVDDTGPDTFLYKNGSKACPHKYALICCGTTKDSSGKGTDDSWVHAALIAYFVLFQEGYKPNHIVFVLWHKNIERNTIDNWLKNYLKNLPQGKWKINGVELSNPVNKNELTDQKINDMWSISINDFTHDKVGKKFATGKQMFLEGIKTLKEIIKDKNKDKIEVTIYLTDHGYPGPDKGYYFSFDDSFDVSKEKQWNYRMSAEELSDNLSKIECKKMLIYLDFCFSGGFINKLKNMGKDGKELIIVTATDDKTTGMFDNNCGSAFFTPFWNELKNEKKIEEAYEEAKRKCGQLCGGRDQKPQIEYYPNEKKNDLKKYNQFKNESINDETSLNIIPEYDEAVGVSSIFYRIDRGEWLDYINPFSIQGEGLHTLDFYAVDYLGNIGHMASHNIYVDTTPPETPSLLSPTDNSSTTTTPSFDWSDVEDISEVYYTLQIATDESFKNIVLEKEDIVGSEYIMNKSEALSMGTYYWHVKAIDGVNNSGEWSQVWSFTVTKENNAPDKPSIPVGPTTGKINVSYTYSSSTTDAEGDKIQYIFDWGDGTFTWTDWYDPGETVNASHTWYEKGTYQIKVKAIDIHGYESEWSDPLPVTMPYSFNIKIENPEQGYLYIFGKKLIPLRHTIIIGSIKIGVNSNELNKVEFYIDGKLKNIDHEPSFTWTWDEFAFGWHEIKIIAYDFAGNSAMDEQKVWIFNT